MKKYNKLIVGFVLVFIVVIFSAINTEDVNVNFGFTSLTSPLIFVILGSTFLGGLIVVVFSFSTSWQQRRELKKLRKIQAEFEENKASELAEKDEQIAILEADNQELNSQLLISTADLNLLEGVNPALETQVIDS